MRLRRQANVNHVDKNKKRSGWTAAAFIFAGQALESLAFLEIGLNLFQYLLTSMRLPITASANGVTNFMGSTFLLTLLGAYVSDSWLGRFQTVMISGIIELLGYVLILLSASVNSLRPPPCLISNTSTSNCKEADAWQKGVLFLGLYLTALGAGGLKSSLPPLGAAQFEHQTNSEDARVLELSKFFNWYVFSIALGALGSVTVGVYVINNVSRSWGFAIPAAAMLLSLLSISVGYSFYRKGTSHPASGPLTQMAQVFVAAIRNRNLPSKGEDYLYEVFNKADQNHHLRHSDRFHFLDKAATMTIKYPGCEVDVISPWKLCTVTQVEKVKLVLSLVPIFASTIMMNCALAQLQTFYVGQGRTMDRRIFRHFEIPAASLAFFPLVVQMFTILIYDKIVVQIARKFTGKKQGITHLQRSGLGLLLSIFSMITAALVEKRRIKAARDHSLLDNPAARIPFTIYWLIPQYLIFGMAETFTLVGMLDFFYSEAPSSMRTIATSLTFVSLALGNFSSSALVAVVQKATKGRALSHPGWLPSNLNRSKLSNFYWLLAALIFLSFLNFLFWAWWYEYRSAAEKKAEMTSSGDDDGEKGKGGEERCKKLELTINPLSIEPM